MLDFEEDMEEYEVEEVKDCRIVNRRLEYLVKWLGWLLEYN